MLQAQEADSQKYEGLLTGDGDLTTGLAVIVAPSGCQTNDFTVRYTHRPSADE